MNSVYKISINNIRNFLIFFLLIGTTFFFNNLFFMNNSLLGFEYIAIYIFYSLFLLHISIFILNLSHIKNKIFLVFIFYKVPLSILMLYFIIHKWDGGDLPTYYYYVVNSLKQEELCLNYFGNVHVIQYFNYLIFHILPNSLYGMILIYALISMLSYLLIYKLYKDYSFNSNLLFIVLLMLPIITFQSSFFGKDAYILIFVSLIFLSFDYLCQNKIISIKKFIYILLFLLCLYFIYLIRSYQAAMIICALYMTFISRNKSFFIVGLLSGLIISFFLIHIIISKFLGHVGFNGLNIADALSVIYQGGSLMLEPFVIPFHMLQIFRPFPWEANSIFMFIVSIENAIILSLIVFLAIKNFRKIIIRIRTNKLYTFLFFYVLINLFIFSFNPNMGDLTRREIYFIPFLLVLLV